MIQSKFKYNSELGATACKIAYKTKGKRKDLLLNIFVPIAFCIMIGMLIYDIKKGASYWLDIVLLILLFVIEVLNFVMPFIVRISQKKYLKQLDEQEIDFNLSEYDKGVFKEKMYKDSQLVYSNSINADDMVDATEFEHYMIIVFKNFTHLVFDLDQLVQGSKEDLISVVKKIKNLNSIKPKKRK